MFQSFSLTSLLAESIRIYFERHTHPAARGIPDPRSNSLALHLIHCLHHSRLCSHLDYPSHRSSWASFQCRKRLRVHCRDHFRLDDGRFSVFGKHSILEFVLQRFTLQTKLVAMVIFPTIQMQPHHHVERLTRMLWRFLPYPKCILR